MEKNRKKSCDLTVIIPTIGKRDFIYRWMSYSNEIEFPYKVIIADGSSSKDLYNLFSNKQNFSNVDYKYIKYPHDKSYDLYYKKLADVISKVKTTFTLLGDDDDFYLPIGIKKSLSFLKKNPQYIACRGNYGILLSPSKRQEDFNEFYDKKSDIKFAFSSALQNLPITNNSSLNRVKSHFNNYTLTWYDICRTDILKNNLKLISDVNLKDALLFELLASFLIVASGKIHRINDLFLIRQSSNPYSMAKTHEEQHGDHFHRMLLKTWSEDFIKFSDSIAETIVNIDSITKKSVQLEIMQGYKRLMSNGIRKSLNNNSANNISKVLNKSKSSISNGYSIMRNNMLELKYQKNGSGLQELKEFLINIKSPNK